MTGSIRQVAHDRLEDGEANVHSALVYAEEENARSRVMSEADTTNGRQIYNAHRDDRRRNFAGLLTVALCALAAFYAGRTFSFSRHVDPRAEASDAPLVMDEVNTAANDDLNSAKAKVLKLKKQLENAQAKVAKLAQKTSTEATTTKQMAEQEATTAAQKTTTAEQKATTAERKATTAAATTAAATTAAATTAAATTAAATTAAATSAAATTAATTTAAEQTTSPEKEVTTKKLQTTTVLEKEKGTTTAKGEDDKNRTKKGNTTKGEPAVPDPTFGWPTAVYWPRLFCFSVMNKDNQQEVATMKMQVNLHIGIASCERFAILSGARVYLGDGHKWDNGTAVKVYSWLNPAKAVPMGNLQAGDETNSFKNTDIFINAWNILIGSKIMEGDIDWVIKADPDAVFFPERLRKHVKPFSWGKQKKTPMYFKNCNYKGPKLYGALEVFNQAAMLKLSKHMKWCTGLPWGGWGEDEFIDKCMERLQARALEDYKLVGDHRCMSAECEATDRASFHDYKSPELYGNCWNRSKNSEKWAKKMSEGNFFCCTSPGNPGDPCNTCNPGAKTTPNQGWCGSSKSKCKGCGNGAEWCQFDKKKRKNIVAA